MCLVCLSFSLSCVCDMSGGTSVPPSRDRMHHRKPESGGGPSISGGQETDRGISTGEGGVTAPSVCPDGRKGRLFEPSVYRPCSESITGAS